MEKNSFVSFMYQSKTFLRVAVVIIVVCLFSLFILRYFISQRLGDDYKMAFYTLSSLRSYLAVSIALPVIILFLFSSIITAIIMIYLSHKIAGPLYRLEKHIESLLEGVFDRPVKFRAGDQIVGLETEVNRLTTFLREKYEKDEATITHWNELINKARDAQRQGATDKSEHILRELRALL